jgi:hypothetical protein
MFFVMPGFHDGVHQYMDDAGIRALHTAGQIVGADTCHHATLTLLAPIPMMAELADCKHQIENIVGVPVRYLAFPMELSTRRFSPPSRKQAIERRSQPAHPPCYAPTSLCCCLASRTPRVSHPPRSLVAFNPPANVLDPRPEHSPSLL